MLKQQLEAVIHENTILKRAVSIQHERQKEFDEMGEELHKLKQLVSQYQEQVRTLEVRFQSYVLGYRLWNMHSSILHSIEKKLRLWCFCDNDDTGE